MTHKASDKGGQEILAALLRPLRALLEREPTHWQLTRMLDILKTYNLGPDDSVFIIVAILEGYLLLVQQACLGVRRMARRLLWTCCLVGVVCGLAVALPIYVIDTHRKPSLVRPISEDPMRAFLRATIARIPDNDIDRIASSRDALDVLHQLPQATDEQLQAIAQYLKDPARQGNR